MHNHPTGTGKTGAVATRMTIRIRTSFLSILAAVLLALGYGNGFSPSV